MVCMKQRTISAMILLVILIGCLVISSKLFGIVMLVISILGFNEFFDIKYKDRLKELRYIKLLGILGLILVTLNNTFYRVDINVVILFPLIILSLPIIFYNDNKLYNIFCFLFFFFIFYFFCFFFLFFIYF